MLGGGVLHQWTIGHHDRTAPQSARREFRHFLESIGTAGSDYDAAQIIFGELVANAVEHGRGAICVSVCRAGDELYLAVRDEGGGFFMRPSRHPHGALALRGRGLHIVRALSERVDMPNAGASLIEALLPIEVSQRVSARRSSA